MVFAASTNPERYAYKAIHRLTETGYEVIPVGIKTGTVAGIAIRTDQPILDNIDTITLYLNPQRQESYYDYILAQKPKRIIFNPGTENMVLAKLAQEQGIEVLNACTLVLLSIDQY